MTPEELQEIAEITEKATPGPWRADYEYLIAAVPLGRPGGENIAMFVTHPHGKRVPAESNCEFTAASRTAVPKLLEHIREQQARIAELERKAAAFDKLEGILRGPICGNGIALMPFEFAGQPDSGWLFSLENIGDEDGSNFDELSRGKTLLEAIEAAGGGE